MATIVHFEIPADDMERARKFYTELFGWKMENAGDPSGEAGGEYWLITTYDDKGTPAICGGMMKRQGPQHGPTNYVGVPSVDDTAKKLESLGGKIIMKKTTVPGHGYFVCCLDTENNIIALWEDDKEAK
jgi:predicted enzyme related to lactoylglutathione lyase